jgi:hypothetical protein
MSLAFAIFLVGLFNLVPFITWVVRTTAIPEKYSKGGKSFRILASFRQLFGGTPNPTSWAVVMSLVTGITCLLYSIILAFLPIDKAIDFILAVILVIITVPSLVAFGYDVIYMKSDMYAGSIQRVGEFFKTGNYRYLAWITSPLIFGFSVVGTMASSLTFLYVAYYLITRQPNYVQLAGKRR